MSRDLSLEELVDLLDGQRQRATYGAVASYLRRPATFLMSGIERGTRYSWIVNQKTLAPTGYGPQDTHPDLKARSFVLMNEVELRAWIGRRTSATPAA